MLVPHLDLCNLAGFRDNARTQALWVQGSSSCNLKTIKIYSHSMINYEDH